MEEGKDKEEKEESLTKNKAKAEKNKSKMKEIGDKLKELKSNEQTKLDKAKYYATVSLANLIHLIGDLYQPNHNYSEFKHSPKPLKRKSSFDSSQTKLGSNSKALKPNLKRYNSHEEISHSSDRGGTLAKVQTNGLIETEGNKHPSTISLHFLFDSVFEPAKEDMDSETTQKLVKSDVDSKKHYSPEVAHENAVKIAEEQIYPAFEKNGWKLNTSLINEMKEIAFSQLKEAGAHIAWYLKNLYEQLKKLGLKD